MSPHSKPCSQQYSPVMTLPRLCERNGVWKCTVFSFAQNGFSIRRARAYHVVSFGPGRQRYGEVTPRPPTRPAVTSLTTELLATEVLRLPTSAFLMHCFFFSFVHVFLFRAVLYWAFVTSPKALFVTIQPRYDTTSALRARRSLEKYFSDIA